MSVRMTALKPFTNPRISIVDKGGSSVRPGDHFDTDWLHAKELVQNGLAAADNASDLDNEPHDAVEPSNQMSVADHKAVNARRAKARGDDPSASGKAPASGQEVGTAGAITSASVGRAAAAPAAATGAATGGPRTNAPALPPVPNPTEPAAS